MRLMCVGARGAERSVVLDADDRAYDISPVAPRIDRAVLAGDGLAMVREALEAEGLRQVDIAGERVGAPIGGPGTVVCIGLNHTDHAAETGAAVPSEQVVFVTASNIVIGPHDDVLLPRGSTKTDWEVEPVVVLPAWRVTRGHGLRRTTSSPATPSPTMCRSGSSSSISSSTTSPACRCGWAGRRGHARRRPVFTTSPALDGLGRQRQTVGKA